MASSADAERGGEEGDGAAISVVEWQGWGTSSPVTATVMEVIKDIKALARDSDAPMTFGGLGGKLKVIKSSLSSFHILFLLIWASYMYLLEEKLVRSDDFVSRKCMR